MAKKFQIEGAKELNRMIKKLGEVPNKVSNSAARSGATVIRRTAKKNAPEDMGYIKQGIVNKREKRVKKGKDVYDITFDSRMNHIFVKESKAGKRSYYPASQEYGYLLPNGTYIPGLRYMKKAAEHSKAEAEKKVIQTAIKAIDKVLKAR